MADEITDALDKRTTAPAATAPDAAAPTGKAKVNPTAIADMVSANKARLDALKNIPETVAGIPGALFEKAKQGANQIFDPRTYAPSTYINAIADSGAGQAIGASMMDGQAELLPGVNEEMQRVQQLTNPDLRGVIPNMFPKIGQAIDENTAIRNNAAEAVAAPAPDFSGIPDPQGIDTGPAPAPDFSGIPDPQGIDTGPGPHQTPLISGTGDNLTLEGRFENELTPDEAADIARKLASPTGGASASVGGGGGAGGGQGDLFGGRLTGGDDSFGGFQLTDLDLPQGGGLAGLAALTTGSKLAVDSANRGQREFDRLDTSINTNLSNVENAAKNKLFSDIDPTTGTLSAGGATLNQLINPSVQNANTAAAAASVKAKADADALVAEEGKWTTKTTVDPVFGSSTTASTEDGKSIIYTDAEHSAALPEALKRKQQFPNRQFGDILVDVINAQRLPTQAQ